MPGNSPSMDRNSPACKCVAQYFGGVKGRVVHCQQLRHAGIADGNRSPYVDLPAARLAVEIDSPLATFLRAHAVVDRKIFEVREEQQLSRVARPRGRPQGYREPVVVP